MVQSTQNSGAEDASSIPIEETGVASSYEATKNISCGDIVWQVRWKSGATRGNITGEVVVVRGAKSQVMPEAQERIFGRFATIDDVSATCNPGQGGQPTRSSLLVSGYDIETSTRALGQLSIDQELAATWSFDRVG